MGGLEFILYQIDDDGGDNGTSKSGDRSNDSEPPTHIILPRFECGYPYLKLCVKSGLFYALRIETIIDGGQSFVNTNQKVVV
jgi:hypothetical protein